MIPYPHIDPNIITIGPLHVRWYGMVIAFFLIFYGAFRFFLDFLGSLTFSLEFSWGHSQWDNCSLQPWLEQDS